MNQTRPIGIMAPSRHSKPRPAPLPQPKLSEITKLEIPDDPQEERHLFERLPAGVREQLSEQRREIGFRRAKFLKERTGLVVYLGGSITISPGWTQQVSADLTKRFPETKFTFVNAGIPGPRVPFACQDVAHIDEVCWFFPDLKFVMRHGAEPWADLAVKLMLKWPNLYYSTSAFAPKYYPADVVHFANTRGADKVMYAGYYPMGLELDRIWAEMPDVGFRDHVWPKFLHENATRVFKLDE